MIITKTPLRMSFAGGGSDLKSFYSKFGGAVLSTSIDKYIYVNINKKFDQGIRVAYSVNEEVSKIEDLMHPIVKAALKFMGLEQGIEITTIADIPSRGTGLGSSSSFTSGLLNGLYRYLGIPITSNKLADLSCHIEIDLCEEPIGKQDQYAAVYGGFNLIEFQKNEDVLVTPIKCSKKTKKNIEDNIVIFYTGMNRKSSVILSEQTKDMGKKNKQDIVKEMVNLCYLLAKDIEEDNISNFGEILHDNWMLKKKINDSISNTKIDAWYEIAKSSGSIGGKLLGAGAGGFLMFYAKKSNHDDIIHSLSDLEHIPICFDNTGSTVVYDD